MNSPFLLVQPDHFLVTVLFSAGLGTPPRTALHASLRPLPRSMNVNGINNILE